MKIVREHLNELAGTMEKDPHGDFLKAKEILLRDLSKYLKIRTPDKYTMSLELRNIIDRNSSNEDDQSIWKDSFEETYMNPIITHLNALLEATNKLKDVDSVGNMEFLSSKKPTLIDKIKHLGQ